MPALWVAAYGEWKTKFHLPRRIGDWHVESHRSEPGFQAGVMDCELWVPLRS